MKQKATYYLFLFVLTLPNLVLSTTEQLTWGGRIAGVAMPLAVYWLLLSLSRKTGRTMIMMLPVLFLGAFQMVLTYLYGRGPIAVDMWLNLVTTNSGEVGELLSQLLPAIVWVVVIYIPTLALAATLWARKRHAPDTFVKKQRLPALCATTAALLYTATLTALTPYSPTNDMFPLNAVCNFGMAFGRQTVSVRYKESSKDFKYYAKCSFADNEAETLVLVIGETSRADNWQLYGYSRKTNPLLTQTKGLTVFTDYMSQSNTTHKSVPILLSLAEADNYDILYHTKGIMQAFREAGYHTVYLSNQQRNHSFIDFLGEQADDCLFLRDSHPDNAYDTDLLVPLAQKLARQKGRRTFVVLHTYGSHFSYADRYPDNMREFQSDQYDGAKRQYRPQLINAYDNSICQTDLLLRRIIEQLTAHGGSAAMVYTSDHGEDIFDDARHLFLHASPFPSFWQLHVPLIVWTSPTYRQRHGAITSALDANRHKAAESNSVFHTLLTMGGVTTSYRNDSLSLASPTYTSHRRLFIDDHNQPRTYRECMTEEDLKLMKEKHITK
ncbi:MAG: sulfatase-like hydrolase/transferase [Prevotellaceae bacterium]|nr:sulfatase-like hydrolase/transferase [Prevotellaceae bacterium]